MGFCAFFFARMIFLFFYSLALQVPFVSYELPIHGFCMKDASFCKSELASTVFVFNTGNTPLAAITFDKDGDEIKLLEVLWDESMGSNWQTLRSHLYSKYTNVNIDQLSHREKSILFSFVHDESSE